MVDGRGNEEGREGEKWMRRGEKGTGMGGRGKAWKGIAYGKSGSGKLKRGGRL